MNKRLVPLMYTWHNAMFWSRILHVHVVPTLEAGLTEVKPKQMHCLLVTFLRKRGIEKFSLYVLQMLWVTTLFRCNFGSRAISSFWLYRWLSAQWVTAVLAVEWGAPPHAPSSSQDSSTSILLLLEVRKRSSHGYTHTLRCSQPHAGCSPVQSSWTWASSSWEVKR